MPCGKVTDTATMAAIIAYHQQGSTIKATAEAFGVSRATVARVIKEHPEMVKLAEAKQAAASETMDAFLEVSRAQAQAFIAKALVALADDDKIAKATLVQIATSIGIVIDKWGVRKLDTAPEVRGGVIEIPAVSPEADDDKVVKL